jgi:hypothetical protein
MNPWYSPERVGVRHPKNIVTDLVADRRPTGSLFPDCKSPEQLETLSMPPNDSLGFDDDKWFLLVASETTKQNPEKTVLCANLRLFLMTSPDDQLLEDY